MQQETDIAYYQRRALEARNKAEHANDPASYRMHIEFARQYERKVMALLLKAPR